MSGATDRTLGRSFPIARGALLACVLATPAAASLSAAVTSQNPFVWGDYARTFARFEIAVTNTGAAPDAFAIGEVEKPAGLTAPVGRINAPTPTLPLGPGESGTLVLWLGGFEQPPPEGPAAGDYAFTVQVKSTVDGASVEVTATIRRQIPPAPGTGAVSGRITDAVTGDVLEARVGVGDPASVLAGDRSVVAPGGQYLVSDVPAGTYWLWADVPGYRSAFASGVTVVAGQTATRDLALEPSGVHGGSATPTAIGDAGLPTYRAAYTPDVGHVATLPGFYTPGPGDPPRMLHVFPWAGAAAFAEPLPATSSVPHDVGEWTSTDGGVDLTADGALVAVGTAGGTVAVYDAAGSERWQTARDADVNPRVPGPLGQGLRRSSEVRFSLDGTRLAAGSLTGWVYCFAADTGALAWQFATAGQVRALRFSADGARLYAGSGDNRLYALDAATGALLWEAALGFWPWEHVALTADGQRIAVGGKDGVVRVFDAAGTPRWTHALPGFVNGLDYTPDGAYLIVNHGSTGLYGFGADGTLRWYRRETLGTSRVFVGADGRFFGVGFASTSGTSPSMRVYAVDGTPVWEYRGTEPNTVYQLAFAADGSRLAANDRMGRVLFFEDWLDASGGGGGGGGGGGAVGLAGKRLVLTPRALALVAKDGKVGLGGAAGDPTAGGATLALAGGGLSATWTLPAAGWRRLGAGAVAKGFQYRDRAGAHGPIRTLVVKNGKLLTAKGGGPALGLALATDPGHVDVALAVGPTRYCLRFGGQPTFKPGRKFSAGRAAAPPACP